MPNNVEPKSYAILIARSLRESFVVINHTKDIVIFQKPSHRSYTCRF